MKKIIAILMALAMLLSFAACGNKDDDGKEDKDSVGVSDSKDKGGEAETEEDAAAVEEALLAAAKEYYAAVLSCKGQKIKNIMPAVFEEIFESEDFFANMSEDDKALISAIYGIDFSSVTAVYEFYAIGILSELGDVDDISVKELDYKKLSDEELEEESKEIREAGVEEFEFEDGARADVDIIVTYSDGESERITQKLLFLMEDGAWKVCADDEAEDGGSSDDNAEGIPAPESDDAAINAAATAYYDAIVSGDGAAIKNSMSSIFEKILESEDPFADYTAEEMAEAEAEFGISLSGPNDFYVFYAAMIKAETGDVSDIEVTAVDYEKVSADEVATMNSDLAAEGITGLNITDCAEAEVKIEITFADGTVENDVQYITFIEENGSWKVFPDM